MYARLIRFSIDDPSKGTPENAQKAINERVIPTLSEYDGYAGYLAFMDKEHSHARAVILWESEEHAEAAEQTLAQRRRDIASSIGLSVESTDLYEAIAVDVPVTARA